MFSPHRAKGLPPRRRGRRERHSFFTLQGGTTPAQAGKTSAGSRTWPRPWDYPRAGGEDPARLGLLGADPGLPPRRRGRLGRAMDLLSFDGTTPAQAGKTRQGRGPGQSLRDYPRAGGEDRAILVPLDSPVGLPPRRRGRHGPPGDAGGEGGTTPAQAGKTRGKCAARGPVKDDPRAGGEDISRMN